ncbi:hypothetical protein TWF703_004367 [Orbilia oligospora]|uniref:DUF7580 domain-containing protein n=1 Tax=Orbilia oligospora TaxID=2813651 RepID=A0A7C8NM42_ORBOL|nr:hypothetical protein TWF703_004367 [Orbilia oligospora]
MIHSCETEGEVHVLDERIPEWRLLQDVRPLFASNPPRYKSGLSWILEPYDKSSGDNDEQTWTVKARNDFSLFKHELQELPETAPKGELSCETFEDCLKHLCNLLGLLNQLIKDSVLGHKLSSIETGIFSVYSQDYHSRAPADDGTEEVQGNKSAASIPINYMRMRPRQAVTNFFPKRIKTPFKRFRKITSSVGLSKRPNIGSAPTMDNVQNYLKVRALGNIVNAVSLNGANIVEKCAVYINLEQTAEVYAKGFKILEACNAWFELSDVSSSNLPKLLYPINVPRTNWKDTEPAIASSQLFEILSKNVHACGDETGHQAMLCLSDIQLNARPLIFNLFFLTCKYPSYWQDSRFNTISNYRDTRREARRVKNLCKLIYEYHQELQLNSTALNLFFDEEQLFVTTTGLLVHRGVFPTISLKELLTDGYFRKPTAGGAFGSRDKAVLALSLARCLLHLLQGPWIKGPWTADSFQFLHAKEKAELLDVHHPYVRWPRGELPPHDTEVETTESNTDEYRGIFLEFACLLLEIQVGETIAFDHLPSMDLEDKEDILYEKADNLDIDEPLAHYCDAITGCLKFKALLASHRKSDGKSSLEEQIRKVIYTNVITPLERHFSIFPNPKTLQTQRNLQLQDRLINSVQPMKDSNAQGEPQVQRGPLSASETHFETRRNPNEGSSYAKDFILSNLRALEDPRYPNFEETLRGTEAAGIITNHNQNHTGFKNPLKPDAYDFAVLDDDDLPSIDSQNELKEHHIALLKQKLESILKLVAPMNPSNVPTIRFVNDWQDYTGTSTWGDPPVIDPYWFRTKQNKGSNALNSLEASLDENIIQPLVVKKIRNGGFKKPLIVIVLLGRMTIIENEDCFKKAILSCKYPNDTDEYGGTAVSFIFSGVSSIIHKPTHRFLSRLDKYKELKEWVFCSTRALDENCAVMRRAVNISAAHGNPKYAKQVDSRVLPYRHQF